MDIRPYQLEAIDQCRRAFASGSRRILLQAPTGAGKTVIAAQIVESAARKGRRILFLAHRRELVNQCADKLRRFGVDYGILMAGEDPSYEYEVQVASIDTLRVRCMKNQRQPMPKADVVIIDEAHRAMSRTYQQVIEYYVKEHNAAVLGMTATPIRSDGRGLGSTFESMVRCPSIRELTKAGYLVPVQYYAPTIPDLTGIKIVRGDYDERELEKAMDQRKAVGDIVENWVRVASDRPTIVFATSVKHSMHIRDEFVRAGFRAAHIDGTMGLADRDEVLRGLASDKYQIVTNCMVLTEGFDDPKLSCCVLARPTKNPGLYLQMAGRTLRPSPGKSDCILLDHSGNVYEHGFVADDRSWELSEGKAANNGKAKQRPAERRPITCVKCAHVYEGQLRCPRCRHLPERKGKYVDTRHADLNRIAEEERRSAKKKVFTQEDKQRWYSMLTDYALRYNKKQGWVAHAYRDKFGVWPRDMLPWPVEADAEVKAFIRHKQIRFAKSQRRHTHAAPDGNAPVGAG